MFIGVLNFRQVRKVALSRRPWEPQAWRLCSQEAPDPAEAGNYTNDLLFHLHLIKNLNGQRRFSEILCKCVECHTLTLEILKYYPLSPCTLQIH